MNGEGYCTPPYIPLSRWEIISIHVELTHIFIVESPDPLAKYPFCNTASDKTPEL